jgi:hypothetical protein
MFLSTIVLDSVGLESLGSEFICVKHYFQHPMLTNKMEVFYCRIMMNI